MTIITIGIDLAKNIFAVHGVWTTGDRPNAVARNWLNLYNAPMRSTLLK